MEKTISWLNEQKITNILLTAVFFLGVVVFHDEVTQLAIKLRRSMSLSGYNLIFTVAAGTGFFVWMAWILLKIRKNSMTGTAAVFLLPTMLLIILFFVMMQTYAIEAVHFFQYAILAILLFPLVKSYGATVFWATFLGVLDETYQYVILTPDFKYFDFNDVLLNLLGAGLTMVTVYLVTGIRYPGSSRKKAISYVLGALAILTAGFSFLYLGDYIRWYPEETATAHPWITVNRSMPSPSFWTQAYEGKFLHILRPWEGMVLMGVLIVYYFILDKLQDRKPEMTSHFIL